MRGLIVALGVLCAVLAGCGKKQAKVKVPANLKVRSLEIIDPGDKTRMRLEMLGDPSGDTIQPSLTMYDEKGKNRLSARITSAGNPIVTIHSRIGGGAALIDRKSGPGFEIYDSRGKTRVMAYVGKNGLPMITLAGPKGNMAVVIGVGKDGSGFVLKR